MKLTAIALVLALAPACTGGLLRAESAYSERELSDACDGVDDRWQEQFPEDHRQWIIECRASLLRGDKAIQWYDAQRRVYNDIIVRQDLLANDESVANRIRVRRAQIHVLGIQDQTRCYRLVVGAGFLDFDPSYYLPRSLVSEESYFMSGLFDQTLTRPENYVLTDEDRAAAKALHSRQLARLTPEAREQIRYVEEGYTGPFHFVGMTALCDVARWTLDELSAMPAAERTRLFKALLSTDKGWMVAQSKTADRWALRRGDIPKSEQYPWRSDVPLPSGLRDMSGAI